ncbi:hypothetical protein EVAR_98032_1 [Eumeta japonica]|uniref:Uncharacterized protein n=1 Tax=Eumeta variegata TaxID=151549 RepID=A0A4C1ZY84_EUMVA|nr:hypothetical protein EVAR_98032_1 [Eumeta japonica]
MHTYKCFNSLSVLNVTVPPVAAYITGPRARPGRRAPPHHRGGREVTLPRRRPLADSHVHFPRSESIEFTTRNMLHAWRPKEFIRRTVERNVPSTLAERIENDPMKVVTEEIYLH